MAFDALQLELPCIPPYEGAADWCQSPASILTEFLSAVGVSDSAQTAQRLLDELGSLAGVLTAPSWRLRPIAGRRLAHIIRATAGLAKARLVERVTEKPVVPRLPALLEFLQLEVGFLDHERLLALYLDAQSRLIRIERIADGSVGEVVISARGVIGLGLAIGATAFILVHNHPSGNAVPSRSDLNYTARLKALGKELELHLVDHLIIARGRVGSIEDFWREARWAGEGSDSSPTAPSKQRGKADGDDGGRSNEQAGDEESRCNTHLSHLAGWNACAEPARAPIDSAC